LPFFLATRLAIQGNTILKPLTVVKQQMHRYAQEST
jgi:hypothetical protein